MVSSTATLPFPPPRPCWELVDRRHALPRALYRFASRSRGHPAWLVCLCHDALLDFASASELLDV